ncbi:MAG: hypothetical protein K2Y17_01795 [Qipengyuania sp.]|nr:hypothetical protein [Qipengyuania sp.]
MRNIAKHCLVPLALGAGSALAAQGAAPAMLAKLQRGQWAVASRDGGPSRTICLGNTAQLIQLNHAGSACSRFVVEDAPDKVTVQYTCRRNGYGRTSIRKETDTLVQIESQGIAGGLPFQFHAEARRTGACR